MKKNIQISLAVFFILAIGISIYLRWGRQDIQAIPGWNMTQTPVDEVGPIVNPGGSMAMDSGSVLGDVPQDSLTIIRSGDAKKCATLSGSLQWECQDAILYNAAIDFLQYDKCDTIAEESLKKSCLDKISKTLYGKAGVLADCTRIRDEEIKKICITRFSAPDDAVNGLASCASISNTDEAARCTDEYYMNRVRSGETKDAAVCSKITNTLSKRECQVYINERATASTAKDASVGEVAKADCAGNSFCMKGKIVAESGNSGNTTPCLSISETVMQKACANEISANQRKSILDSAITAKDPNICNKITIAAAASRCKEIVGKQ